MKYFPIFADVETRRRAGCRRRRAGRPEGAPAAEDGCAHHGDRRDGFSRAGGSRPGKAASAIVRRPFAVSDVAGKRLVYAATGDRQQDAAVSHAAQVRGIPVNVVDAPELSTFITPAIVDRDPVTVAIGTEGAAPVLAREIKTRLEAVAAGQPRQPGASGRRACATSLPRSIPDGARAPPTVGAAAARPVPPCRAGRRRGRGRARARRRAERRSRTEQGSRRPDRLRPRRSRSPHPQGPAAHAGGRRAGDRPARQPEDPGLRPPRRRAHLRRQDAARPRHLAGRDRPHPGARGFRREGGGPSQGRRSLHLRPRRRGDGSPAGRRHRRRGGARHHGSARLRRPRSACR